MVSTGRRNVIRPRFSFCFGGLPLGTLSLSPETEVSVKHFVHTIGLMCAQNCRWYEYEPGSSNNPGIPPGSIFRGVH
jgi:hypothetical protein